MRLRRIRILVAIAALAVVALGAACSPQEETAFRSVNALRDASHLRWLDWNAAAYDKAVAWSNHMADEGKLSHSNLADGIPAGWSYLGENVAYASSISSAIDTLEASAPHRANMLNTNFRSVGIGVVTRNGKVWVTEVFVG